MNFLSEYTAVKKILAARHEIIFYAESRYYFQYYRQLINDLTGKTAQQILYITSDENDPLLSLPGDGLLQVMYIKWWLGFLFPRMRAAVVVLTMPDLENFAFKRSANVDNYVYIFHAAVSTHQQYNQKAFFYFDTIFCTGQYHADEIRAAEKKFSLPPKTLIPYGYPLFDDISAQMPANKKNKGDDARVILVAPSWYDGCILETCIEQLTDELVKLPFLVVIRPHPEYTKRHKKKFGMLVKRLQSFPSVSFDNDPDVIKSILHADILITDRSGIAFEYALGTGAPVLFIDMPLKITNSHYQELGIEPLENAIRAKLGACISPTDIGSIAEKIEELDNRREQFGNEAAVLKKKYFFNSPAAYEKGVEWILSAINKPIE